MIRSAACLALAALLLSGCAHRSVEYGGARYTSTTLGSNTVVGNIEITKPDGTRVVVTGFGSAQSEGLRAVSEGISAGVVKGLKGGVP